MHYIKIHWIAGLIVLSAAGSLAAIIAFHDRLLPPPQRDRASSRPADVKRLWHCGMHPQVVQDHPGECPICHMALTPVNRGASAMGDTASREQAGPEVHIDPNVVQNMGVRTARAVRGPLTKTIRTVGVFKLPEPGLHDVALKMGGWIETLYANQEGMHVMKGQPLFDLYSPELQVVAQELISAVAAQKSADAGANAALRLDAQSMIESVKQKLRLWGVAEQDIDAMARAVHPPRTIPFRSPISGHLEDKTIVQGSAVQPGMKLMRIADHSKMWLDAAVYQEQLGLVKAGQEIVATVDGLPGEKLTGVITIAYPHIDPMTRTLTVRITVDNPRLALRPGMYATVQIITHPESDVILVPREAVIDTGTRQFVFIDAGNGSFIPRNVRMGMTGDDDAVQIVDGVALGETVVTSGQFLMDVESRTIEGTQKLASP